MTEKEKQLVKRVCPECGESYEGESLEYCPQDGTRLRALGSNSDSSGLIGASIDGRFSVEAILGEGGMGKVYRGEQLSVGRQVAIKVLRAELADDETLVRRFFREAQVISQFSHPNIVNLVDFGRDETHDVLYLAMEYIDGVELGDLVESYRLTPELAVDIMYQTCEALSEPHADGVVHRDLKPENLMLVAMSSGRVQAKVVDFGIAHALQSQEKLTQTGSVFGTAHYMAPEQAQGGEIAPTTDVYALGCIFYELLTGHLPYKGATAMQMMMNHIQTPSPEVGELMSGGAEVDELSELVRRMMSKSADERPQSVLAIRDRLEEIQRTYRYDTIRVDNNAAPEEMFSPWLNPPLDGEGTSGPASDANTNAPVSSSHDTSDYGGTAGIDDRELGTADTMIATSEGGEVDVSQQTPDRAEATTEPERSTAMSTRAIAAQLEGNRSNLMLAIGIFIVGAVITGLVLMVLLGDDEQVAGESSEGDTAVIEEHSPDSEPSGVSSDPDSETGEQEQALDEQPAEEADIDDGDQLEQAASEPAEPGQPESPQPQPDPSPVEQDSEPEPEPQPEPEPAPEPAPQPQPQPEPEPAPEPAPQPQPQPEPEPAEEEPDEQEDDDEQGLDIFPMD